MYSLHETHFDYLACKITFPSLSDPMIGSGTIVSVEGPFFYVITCSHVIEEAQNIRLEIVINDTIQETLLNTPRIVRDDKNDIALLILTKEDYPCFLPPDVIFGISDNRATDVSLCGFPAVKNNNSHTSIPRKISIDRGRIDGEIYRTDIRLETHATDGYDNCRGLSGCPLYSYHMNFLYFFGIAKGFSDELSYFDIIPVKKINNLLFENDLEQIPLFSSKVQLCNALHDDSKKRISDIRCHIGDNIELDRTEIIEKISQQENGVNIFYGEPGIGKSTIIKKFTTSSDVKTFYFRGEDCNESLHDKILAIEEFSALGHSIFVVFDSLEKIFELQYEQFYVEAMNCLHLKHNIAFFIGIRNYSKENLIQILQLRCRIDQCRINQIEVSLLSANDFKEVTSLYPTISNLRQNTAELLKNPFYLDQIICGKLFNQLDSIDNEYSLKDLIWNKITDGNTQLKKVLLKLIEFKMNSRSEYVSLDIKYEDEQKLIHHGIIIEKNTFYTFAHDKYADIASSKYFDLEYMEKNIVQLVQSIQAPLSFARAFKLWILDRLSNHELDNIANEIEVLQKNNDVLYLWKWSILEAVYESKSFIDYLYLKRDLFTQDLCFIQQIHNIAISCDLIAFEVNIDREITPYLYFTHFVYPSNRVFLIISFFNSNKELITKESLPYLISILFAKSRFITYFSPQLSNKNLLYLVDFIIFLFGLLKEYDLTYNNPLLFKMSHILRSYIYLNAESGRKFLDSVSANLEDRFNRRVAEFLLTNQKNHMLIVDDLPLNNLQCVEDEVFTLFTKFTSEKSSLGYTSNARENEPYGLADIFYNNTAYPQRTIIHDMFDASFENTFNFVLSYINSKVEYFNNYLKCYENTELGCVSELFKPNQIRRYNNESLIDNL